MRSRFPRLRHDACFAKPVSSWFEPIISFSSADLELVAADRNVSRRIPFGAQ
jgi:hypothetical protein